MQQKVSKPIYHVFFGAPGAGKGYLGAKITDAFDIKVFSSGDLFRKLAKEGKLAKEYVDMMQNGDLIPDEIAIPIIIEELGKAEWQHANILLDGFPRNYSQAVELDIIQKHTDDFEFGLALYINAEKSYEMIRKRVVGRVSCSNPACNRSFNLFTNKPKVDGICDACGSKLVRRKDDDPKIYDHRMDIFYKYTYPAIECYRITKRFASIRLGNHVNECFLALDGVGVPRRKEA